MKILQILSLLSVLVLSQAQAPKRCQIVLEAFEKQANIVFNAYHQQEYSKAIVEGLLLQQYLPQVEQECPVMDEDIEIPFKDAKDCQQTLAVLEDLLENDVVSNFSIIKSITNFQSEFCLPYDLSGNGLQDIIENAEEAIFEAKLQVGRPKGATNCIACGFLGTLLSNYIEIHDVNIAEWIGDKIICRLFKGKLQRSCEDIIDVIGPQLIDSLENKENSDVLCDKLGLCDGWTQCKLHPNEKENSKNERNLKQQPITVHGSLLQKIVPNDWIHDLIKKFTDQHLPVFDYDGDRFSDHPTLRGYNWRGEDCSKYNNKIYPGRKTSSGKKGTDYNCNKITGSNPDSGIPYKNLYCDNSGQLGTILVGDSAGAHFSLPHQWFNVSEWQSGTFSDFLPRLMNEFDIPQESAGTGYVDSPAVSSIYKKLYERNRCNRNDYQNLGVNGASSTNEWTDMLAIARHQFDDHPALVFWELIGNDVCKSSPSPDAMTSPEQFRTKITELWSKLDTILPPGSHIVVSGVADGRVLYECLKDREQPLGIPYPVFYDYLNCFHTSPCAGWMNSDAAIRDATTERANQLNEVYKDIIATTKYQNFDIQYYDFPIKQVIQIIIDQGGQCWDAIEPVDGFHPNGRAEALWADIIWNNLLKDQPGWLGNTNPHNELIVQQYGDDLRYYKKNEKKVDADLESQREVIELQ